MKICRRSFPAVAAFLAVAAIAPLSTSTSHASADEVPIEFRSAAAAILAGDLSAATAAYEAFLTRAPGDPLAPMAHVATADLALMARRDTAAALAHYEAARAHAGGGTWAAEGARRRGELLRDRREWIAAAASLQEAASLGSDPSTGVTAAWTRDVIVAAADCYYQAGAPEKVIATYEAVISSNPPADLAGMALYRLGEAYEDGGQKDRAAATYGRLLTNYPSSDLFDDTLAKRSLIEPNVDIDWPPLLAYQAGTDAVGRRDYAEALVRTDSVLAFASQGPLHECAQYRRITLATTLSGDYTEGCRLLREYLAEHPGGPRTAMARATLDQNWNGVAEMEQNARAHPEDSELAGQLAMSYLQSGAVRKAIELLEGIRVSRPDDPEIANGLGHAYARAGRMEEASASFEKYLAANPSDVDALNLIGYAFLAIGQAPKAIPYFERYASLAPDDPNAHDSLGEGYLDAGRLDDSAREYETAVRLNPDFSNSHFMLATIRERSGRPADAAASYRRFLELVPTGPQAEQAREAIRRIAAAT